MNNATRRNTRQNPAEPTDRVTNDKSQVSKDAVSHFLIDGPAHMWHEPWRSLWWDRVERLVDVHGYSREAAKVKAASQIRHDFHRAVEERER